MRMDTDKSLGARRHRELYLKVLVAAVATAPLLVLVWLFRGDLETLFLDRLIVFASTRLSAEDREAYLRLIADEMPGLFEAVPEPTVGRILMPGSTKEYRGAEVAANNAGMRDAHDYLPKPVGVLRLVCLGDSATLGVGGPERDRWCDQLEESLRERLRPPGVPVEAYTLAVPSWSALNEASYLTSRVSEYRPDIVLGLLVANDISLTSGVTGTGHQTSAFSPERREIGSGAPSVFLPFSFGLARQNLLSSGLGDESRRAWRTAFDAWQRLEGVLERSGGRLVLAAISGIDPLFDELVRHHHAESGLRSPLVFTRAVSRLPHDPHLDRRGHAAIAGHFLHVLAALRWLDLDLEGARPPPAGVDLATVNPPRPERIRALQDEAAAQLPEELAFDRLTVEAVRGLLGGVIPQSTADPLHGGVYGSTETRFLLRRRDESRSVSVAIEVPPREELFPFELELRTQGGPSAALRLDGSGRAGRHQLAVPLAEGGEPVIEVVLETDSYWCEIADPTMKSYRLLSASQQ